MYIYEDSLSFNPCFNGSMYKNWKKIETIPTLNLCFNPCFNGSMYKNTKGYNSGKPAVFSFNPCFNGSMYKNRYSQVQKVKNYLFQSLF